MKALERRDQRTATPPTAWTARMITEPETLRAALARLGAAPDDRDTALSFLLFARAATIEPDAAQRGVFFELSAQDAGMLVTVEDDRGLWLAELFHLTLGTVEAVLADLPELAPDVTRSTTRGGIVLRLSSERRASDAPRATPIALPSLDLLIQAGLIARLAAPADDS